MLAFLGGTGPEGRGLALRLAMAGEAVVIGSRDAARAANAAAELRTLAPQATIEGAANADAAGSADVVFLTFPYEGQRPTLEQLGAALTGKTVVNVIAPMTFQRGRGASAVEVEAGSAAQEAQELLPDSLVVGAFQTVSAEDLQDPGKTLEGDVIVCSDHQGRQGPGDRPDAQDTQPAPGGRRHSGQRQVRGTNHAPAGQHQPDIQSPRRHQGNYPLTSSIGCGTLFID